LIATRETSIDGNEISGADAGLLLRAVEFTLLLLFHLNRLLSPGQWMSWFGIRGLWEQDGATEEGAG
jgi:hypothetical protein